MQLRGRRVVVMGLGRSGRAAARLALREGATVVGVDEAAAAAPIEGARLELGPQRLQTLLQADLIVVSPGIAAAHPLLVQAEASGVEVVGELGFAASFLDVPTVAITGTNGKSTVTSFTGTLLGGEASGVFVGGNLGTALSEAALGPQPSRCVVEVSSYQLELPGRFHPQVGVVLNLTPDHLARHGTMEVYGQTKCRLFAQMGPTDIAMLPVDDALLRAAAEGVGNPFRAWLGGQPGVVVEGDIARIELPSVSARLDLREVKVPGRHNLVHAATAAALALGIGAPLVQVQERLALLRALPHRMEPVGEVEGVLWVNDSKATNVESAQVGIDGLDRRAVVLLGGEAKGGGFAALAPALGRHVAVITFGASGSAIADELAAAGVQTLRVRGMQEAMALAAELATPGTAVLLSPGCASFDEFNNFEHRGDVFRTWALGRLS